MESSKSRIKHRLRPKLRINLDGVEATTGAAIVEILEVAIEENTEGAIVETTEVISEAVTVENLEEVTEVILEVVMTRGDVEGDITEVVAVENFADC